MDGFLLLSVRKYFEAELKSLKGKEKSGARPAYDG